MINLWYIKNLKSFKAQCVPPPLELFPHLFRRLGRFRSLRSLALLRLVRPNSNPRIHGGPKIVVDSKANDENTFSMRSANPT